MARNDDTTVTPPTAEYPEVADSVSSPPAPSGWQGGDLAGQIGQPVDPRERGDRPAPVAPTSTGGGAMRGLFWLVATLGLVVAVALGARAIGVFPDFGNPFGQKETDRSGPALLLSIQDLSRFVAAEGNFEVIVDVQDNRKYVPDFLVNDRILFVAAGSVEAYVDFANIGQGAVKESDERRTVEINLPAPELGKPSINNDRSYVYTQERGLLNRIGDVFSNDPNRLQEIYKLSEEKIAAAANDSQLRQRAQDNTAKMLKQMLTSLGYTSITVKFPSP
jgi:hypothetical protein